mmetsp:Transcript_28854/g.73216  ORF Transcript_28854/g.73216 Transcript_28854/m.73216 type:complete len:228 (+) Transcript_28854:84-767(+)|eukprot:CAMPEP_0183444902 /NCGR_PEP_ID=MMETSP0370-20130417/95989_1 /TAXON_ID=268820 /ORGANISM="Peridinium aciculiferum, Strain PAER-2" /LENGTH=227 /DNA_ID=CAMNT_0025635375 /DNA_START=11 /DNA_END=694 /DNA_ORIENTATION=-
MTSASALASAFSLGAAAGLGLAVLKMSIGSQPVKKQNVVRLRMEDAVFLLCDVQEKFETVIDKMPHVITTAKVLLSAADAMKIPVVVTEQYPKALGKTVKTLDVSKATVFEKTKFSMCTPEVVEHLKHLGRRSAVIFGVEAHVCVQQTALDLLDLGYDVHLVADGVSSQRPGDRATALSRMQQAGVMVTTSESLIFEMLREKEAPEFKAVSRLVNDAMQKIEGESLS